MIPEDQINKNLTQLARKMGKDKASVLLSALGKNKQFLSALDSIVGQELLKDAVLAIQNKMELIMDEKDKPQDRAELQAYLHITRKWSERLTKYNKDKERFNKNVV